jgi:hypothetical protein
MPRSWGKSVVQLGPWLDFAAGCNARQIESPTLSAARSRRPLCRSRVASPVRVLAPRGWVGSNLKRRHLDETQRALVAAKVANLTHGWGQEA